jgi:hypothetical protein
MSLLRAAPAALLVAASIGLVPEAQPANSSSAREVLDLLHAGRFDAAERRTRGPAAGSDPADAFLDAFVYYWRLLYDEKDPELQAAFDRRLGRTLALADARLKARPADADAALWAGTAHLLRGQLYARQKKAVAAGVEAKRARRLLEPCRSADALFGLGSVNYLTGQLEGAARGLRALLGIPPGDRQQGLRQLARAAAESEHFRLESRLILLSLYAGKRERRFDEATRQVERLLSEHPGAVVALDAAGRTLLTLGRVERAAAALDRAATLSAEADPSVVVALRLQRARVELARFRPDRALERLEPLLAKPAAVPEGLRDDVRDTAAAARAIPAASWERVASGVREERMDASADKLVEVAKRHPDDPVAALYAGRALLLAGRAGDALQLLTRADASGRLAGPWIGPARLLAGQAADVLGQRTAAVAWYKKALESPEWVCRDAARQWIETPYRASSAPPSPEAASDGPAARSRSACSRIRLT